MEYQMTDSQKLKNYYSTIYESVEYNDYIMAEKRKTQQMKNASKLGNVVDFLIKMLVASIYLSIFFVFKYHYIYFPIVIFISVFFLIISVRSYRREEKSFNLLSQVFNEKQQLFTDLINRTEKPAMPEDKLNPDFIKTIIAVFDSGRADTFKEALQIHEQDCQHRELVAYQNSLIAAANAARNAADEANARAAKAKKEADYQRREAEYWRQEEWYRRNR